MIELYLFRHVESVPNLTPELICGQSTEASVTAKGELEAQQLGRKLLTAALYPNVVLSSPARRAIFTAEASLQKAGILQQIVIEPDLHEASQGDWEGLSRAQFQTSAYFAEGVRLGKDLKAPNGESINDVTKRGHRFLNGIAANYGSNATIFAYTHGLFTRALVGSLLDWDIEQILSQPTPNASNTLLRYDQSMKADWQVAHVGQMSLEP